MRSNNKANVSNDNAESYEKIMFLNVELK